MAEEQEKQEKEQTQEEAAPGEPEWEEYTLAELEEKLAREHTVYYCVDALRDKKTKRKLVDPRGVLSSYILQTLHNNWDLSPDMIIRVTRNADFFEKEEEAKKSVGFYTGQLYRYVSRIFSEDKSSYKVELQGLVNVAVEMLNGVFGYDDIDKALIHPDDLRTHSTYYDHLVNTAVYWLATFALLNKRRSDAPGSVEVWKSRDKAELRSSGVPPEREAQMVTFYDVFRMAYAPSDLEAKKKSDMSLVLSGFFGALFHDAGLIEQPRIIPPAVKDVPEPLRKHTEKTNQMLRDRLSVLFDERPLTRSVIANHHERLDGSGYPKKKKEKDIHLFARILGVCDSFDELITVVPRGKAVHAVALSAGRGFDGEVVRAFLAILKPYKEGEVFPVYEDRKKEPVMEARVEKLANRFRPLVKIEKAHDEEHRGRAGNPLDLVDPNNSIFFI